MKNVIIKVSLFLVAHSSLLYAGTPTMTTFQARIMTPTCANVNGMIRYNTTSTLFEFFQNGSWVNFTTVSDGRLKKNVEPVEKGLEIVNRLKPVYYDWNRSNPKSNAFPDQHQVGFIAQDVEKVLPEVVNQGEDSYRSVEYGKIVAVVVAAVQELYAKFLNQDREIASLQERVSQSEHQNAELKDYLCKKEPDASFCHRQ